MKVLVTGGAGFIGVHTARRFAQRGDDVVVFDNLSRVGARENLAWLQEAAPSVCFMPGDVTRAEDLAELARLHPEIEAIIHLAGQVAVTTSVADPVADFRANAEGTLNVLEMARTALSSPIVLYASTNKVYGGLEGVAVEKRGRRYEFRDFTRGIGESTPLDFHSPYGCSKGAADQYVRDYHRIYGLPTVVLRQSCIYGTRQFGIEDQGWVAWFTIATQLKRPVTIFGDGCQVRDVLFIDDLVRAYEAAIDRIDVSAGRIYNVGGGPDYAISLLEFLDLLSEAAELVIQPLSADWRPGDQRVYVSDIARIRTELGWEPRIGPAEGIERLVEWVRENREMIAPILAAGAR
ncbi:MAG: CDP-paratose 2-epimerase [Candidatus Sumerlaeota bacterium]|nr:CDP-paratose 2-epimerase [Candidatus Sumerlaeota bacterium]